MQRSRRVIKECFNSGKYPDASHLILFDSTSVDVAESGLANVTMHQLALALKPAGAKVLAVQKYDYDPLSAAIKYARCDFPAKAAPLKKFPSLRCSMWPRQRGRSIGAPVKK